jgi:hypothetical protein
MRTRAKGVGILLILAVLLLASAGLGQAWRGGRVFVSPSIVVPFGPFWGPHWGWGPAWPHFAHPPVVVIPPPATVQPSPPQPQFWYYCDAAKGYYPYVPQCPSGWRAVLPTPPR